MGREVSPTKKMFLALLLCAVTLLGGYGVLVGAVCIWVGARSAHLAGFWVPLLAGVLTVTVALLAILPAVRALVRALRGGAPAPELEGY